MCGERTAAAAEYWRGNSEAVLAALKIALWAMQRIAPREAVEMH